MSGKCLIKIGVKLSIIVAAILLPPLGKLCSGEVRQETVDNHLTEDSVLLSESGTEPFSAIWLQYHRRYAIIVMGGDVTGQHYTWYWNDTFGMYNELLDHGFGAGDIRFLSYGPNAQGNPAVFGESTRANIQAAYQWAQNQCTADDLLYVFWVDHGNSTSFEAHDGAISHQQIGALTRAINPENSRKWKQKTPRNG